MIFAIESLAAAVVFALLAYLLYCTTGTNLAEREKLCRNNPAGLILSLPCALLCVPLAIPVSPDFLVIMLYPLAVILPVLCYFYIDFYAARGLAFFLILWAYDTVHAAFEIHIPGAAAVTITALLWGSAGIWLAAKPAALRDLFRKVSVDKKWKFPAAIAAAAGSLIALYVFIMYIGVLVK